MPENAEKLPLLSIISVVKNYLDGLQRTYATIQMQTASDFEWIVIDGGSGQETTDFLQKNCMNWVSEPDRGIYDAMNKGIERAKGQYLLFLNAGDTLTDSTVVARIAEAVKDRPDFIYGDSYELDAYKPARRARMEYGMFTHHQAMLYRRDKVGELRYDIRYDIAADYEFTARFLRDSPNILYLPFAICEFQPGGVSQQSASLGRREQYQIRKKLKLCNPLTNVLITAAQACLWRLRAWMPSVYWRLKSSGNTVRVEAQT